MSGSDTKRKRMKQRKSADSIAVETGKTFFIPETSELRPNEESECLTIDRRKHGSEESFHHLSTEPGLS
jgi:hypothetical protein